MGSSDCSSLSHHEHCAPLMVRENIRCDKILPKKNRFDNIFTHLVKYFPYDTQNCTFLVGEYANNYNKYFIYYIAKDIKMIIAKITQFWPNLSIGDFWPFLAASVLELSEIGKISLV